MIPHSLRKLVIKKYKISKWHGIAKNTIGGLEQEMTFNEKKQTVLHNKERWR